MIRVVKIGGNIIDNEADLRAFCRDFAALEGPKILVHGGGISGSRMQERLGIEPVRIEGRRVTDAQTLKVVTMVYAGWCNKHITALLQGFGCNAIGLSGCDGNVIRSRKRPPISIGDRTVDFGFVGDVFPESVQTGFLENLLSQEIVPVLSPINHDGAGNLLNTNADTVAASVAAALAAEWIVCFEKEGVLLDVNDPESVLPVLTETSFEKLRREGSIAD